VKTDTTPASSNAQVDQNTQADQSRVAKELPPPTVTSNNQEKLSERTVADQPPPKAEAGKAITESEPLVAARPAAPPRVEATPSFAPPPPETIEMKSREQQNVGGVTHGGPRRSESRVQDRSRAGDVAKEEDRVRSVTEVDENKKDKNQPKQTAESGTLSMSAAARDLPSNGRRTDTLSTLSAEAPSIRSAGGRKFHRQGSAWVDVKFKSSMAVRNVTRGSEEFAALDSRLRSIAQQFSGEVIVVWKGKAYRIQ